MYNYKGVLYTVDQIKEAAKQSNMSVDDYVKELKEQDPEPKTTEQMESTDLLDPNFQQDAAAGADVVSQPMTASQAGVTELPSEDTSSELQDLDPDKPLSASEKRIATRKRREKEKQDRLKAEAISTQNVINDRIKNIPKEDIVAIQANDYFGPIKSRNDRTTVSKTVPGMMGPTVSFEPTFNSDESYTNYLKETLGGKYNQYLDYKETNKIVPLNTQNQSQLEGIYDEAEKQAKDKVYNNSLFNVPENVQEYMVASPNFATGAESLEAQKFLIKEQKQSVEKNYKSYEEAKKEWESQAVPLRKDVENLKTQIDRFKFYTAGASQEQVNQYNELIQTYNSKIQQWEEKGFNELPAFVNSQAKLVNSQQEDYSKMLEDSRKSLINADLFEKNLKQDYSASARVGRVFDEFFMQSGRNFIDLTAEIGLKAAKAAGMGGFTPLSFLTSPENSAKVDSVIQTIQKNNKNYNLKIASKRENIPTSPSIDDIGKDGLSVWDWTSIALQDNSATISTTFVPGLAQLKGATTLTKAIKTGKGVKDALQKQKALWLAGKRTVQGTFFVAETGGKYGELQTDEASREQEIKFLYSKLDNTEDINEKTEIYNKITELEEVEDYSLLQKAFTSFGAGTTATFLETISTLKMLEPAKGLAKQIGIKAAKKELYKQPIRFSANLIGKTLAGLKSLPKNLTGEILEETATELSHNGLDILVLGENKSMFEGINKDFLASTAISSFGIMAPRSAGNIFNIVKSEFRTKSEIFNNQKLARELIDLNESTTLENSKELRVRKKEILKELALSDAISLHKLRYMTSDQIEEVADINRQMRQVNGKFSQLGRLGDLGEAENKRVKKQLEEEYIALSVARQEILDTKQRSNIKRAANMIKTLGAAVRNSNAAFYFGVNDFYNEVAMTQMGDGDFISIKGEIQEDNSIKYEGLDEQLAKYKGKMVGVTDDETGEQTEVDAFEFLKESIENNEFNATQLFGDIIVNQTVIDREILIRPTETGAQYAAVAPLEELFHLSVAQKGIKFDATAKNAVLEAENILKEKRDLGVISEKDYNGLKERFDAYRSSDGKFDAEEFIAQINNAITLGAINRSDFDSAPSFKKFLNNSIRSAFGDMSWMLKMENSDDVFNLVKNFQADVSKGVTFQAPETDELKESRVLSPQAEFLRDELTNEELVASIKSKATEDTFSVAQAIVEKNFGLIRDSNVLTFDKSNPAQINAVKEILEEQILGVFEGSGRGKYSARRTGLFNAYESTKEDGASPSTYLLGVIKTRKPEIDIALKERTIKSEGDSIDSDQAKQVVDRSTKTSVTVDKLAKKPTETTKFKSNYISPEFKKSLDTSKSEKQAIEDKISSTVKESFKDRSVSRFKETGKIPQELAQLYADMFGIKTVSALIEKQRNLQKLDQEGAVRARQFLIDNAAADFARLPRSKDDTGKATGILQTKIGKVLYNKAGELTGSLKTYTDIIKGKNITLEGYDGKQYEFNQLDNEGKKKPIYRDAQHIKAALDFHIRNRALETLIPEQGKRIQAGAKFSRAKEFRKLTKGLSDTQVAQEVVAIQKISEELGVEPQDVLLNINDNISKYKKLRGLLKIKEGGKKNITSVENSKKLTSAYKFFIKDLIPEGKTFNDLPKSMQQAIIDSVGFGDTRMTLGGRPLTYKEITDGVKGYSNLLKKVFGDDIVIGTGSNYSDSKAVFAPRNWGGFRRKVEDIVLKKDITPSEAKTQVEKLLSAEGKTIDETIKANRELLNRGYSSLVNFVIKNKNKESLGLVADILESQVNRATGLFKGMVPMTSFSMKPEKGDTKNQNKLMHNEHLIELFNANKDFLTTLNKFVSNKISESVLRKIVRQNVDKLQQAVISERMRVQKDASGASVRDFVDPLTFLGKDAVNQIPIGTYRLDLGEDFTGINIAEFIVQNLNSSQIQKIGSVNRNKLSVEGIMVRNILENYRSYVNTKNINNSKAPNNLKFSKKLNKVTNQDILTSLGNIDKALSIARNLKSPVKKIRVFDFDDTLATTKSNVLYEMPNGKKGSLTATEFAKRAGELEAKGAEWDFSEFSKVMKGAKGPLFNVAKFISESPGKRDMFVLTARPADAAGPIKEFLDSMGLNIPLENITGLGDGTPQAKARWIIDKAADGYNDFYFADDHLGNVRAVKEILSVVDVKSKVQQAKFSKNLGKTFNDIIQEKTGIASEKTFGSAKAEIMGKGKGRFDIFISPTAEDFAGLLYKTLPKGKKGEQALKFYKENLFDPFARAEDNIIRDQISLVNDVKALKKRLGIIPKKLRKKNETGFTNEQALRVRMWTKMGVEVPGLSKSDLAELNKVIKDNPTYEAFANELLSTTKGDGWAEPGKNWLSGTLTSDAKTLLGKVKRAKYLEQWKQNKDEIFSEANLNKLEAAYGKKYRKALEGTLERMQSGKNRSSQNTAGDRALDYINNSVGAIMFLNTRSAVLQTLSSINFINWTDNNPLKASARLVDVKQYSKDFLEIMNSDYLTARRDGLKLNVSEAEIAADSGARGIINTILKKGFVFTKYADSFAIASGGATFYRNRINTYKKQGLSEVEAKEKAFLDFKDISEKSQQSSGTDKISQQQASNLGRVVLAFANTPMQYARLQKKAILDLANKRGDWRENTSKIVYYGFVQNLIFNVVQNALFGLAFADDEQDEKLLSKSGRVANGMVDSLLRGTGIPGVITAQVKNALMVINSESSKKNPKYSKAVKEIVSISPTVGSKYKKLVNASKAAEYGAFDNMKFSLDNPAYMAMANVISATTNIPVDRALRKSQNIQGALNEDYDVWERIAMAAGWQDWELGIKDEEKPKKRKRKTIGRKIIKKVLIK